MQSRRSSVEIHVALPEDRQKLGTLKVGDIQMAVAGLTDQSLGRADPAVGVYDFERVEHIYEHDSDITAAFGEQVIRFKNVRDGSPMAIHGGDMGDDGLLLPTEGTLRVSDKDLEVLIDLLPEGSSGHLIIEEQRVGFIRGFFRGNVSPGRAPRYSRSYVRDQREKDQSRDDSSLFFWLWLMSSSSSDSGQNSDMVTGGGKFDGGGGQSAGGGFDIGPGASAEDPSERAVEETPLPPIVDPFAAALPAAAKTETAMDAAGTESAPTVPDRDVSPPAIEVESTSFEPLSPSTGPAVESSTPDTPSPTSY